jgi:hypothetical protein
MRRYSPLLLTLFLLGSLAVSQAAAAATTLPQPPTTSVLLPQGAAAEAEEEEQEGEEEFEIEDEFEIEECEATAQEVEFGEMEEAEEEEFEEEIEECEAEAEKGKGKKGETFVTAPAECLVQRAESTITTLPGTDRVRLTVHYKNYSSAPVAIGLKLKDGKGSLALERTTKHFGRSGVLHLTTKLGEAEMERAATATEFDVALRAANTPGYCSEMLEQHLRNDPSAAPAHGSRAHGSRAHASRVYNEPVSD